MADGGDTSDGIKNQTLPEHADSPWEYDEATDSAIAHFRDLSICEPQEQQLDDVYSDSSQSCDESDDTSPDEVEDDVEDEDEVKDEANSCVERQSRRIYDQSADLMRRSRTWEHKVVRVLNMIRRRESYEYNHKSHMEVPTRFCRFNVALFDFDKESRIKPRPLFDDIRESDYRWLENSVNVISVKIAASDVGYPVSIFGTVIARDQVDYRCVYIFNRGRDNPQLVTSPVDTLTLTGPDRSLAVTDSMFFELHLKVKDDAEGDKDFCKCLLEHNTACHTGQSMTFTREGWLSTVKLAITIVPYAVEASVTVSILKGPSNFFGRIVAWTTGNDKNEFIMYDSQVTGPRTKHHGNVYIELTRHIVAVPLDEDLVVNFSLCGSDREAESLEFIIGHDYWTVKLQVKVVWRGVMQQRSPNMWEYFGDVQILR